MEPEHLGPPRIHIEANGCSVTYENTDGTQKNMDSPYESSVFHTALAE